ncbi:marine proteobacterial sortase target protein [Limihaloglobus sulfuriphilus]|uniref:Marine proteobacterial sortase target protein n=1 Tax=Limihaloglobus sulfuriphilus TaxID=1851148 RepID=A0A1Q2MHH5_9BACT|nr:VIT domain-containing protein [Limihaloglobus sulfuriphilus]AQQ72140.1 marine proteobacterial sortase target protein [Limihaloglobus sulfuriphilus]
MRVKHIYLKFAPAAILICAACVCALEHVTTSPADSTAESTSAVSNTIVPQIGRFGFVPGRGRAIEITNVNALIDINETAAATTLEIHIINNTNRRQEAELVLPVPDDAVIKGFAYDGPGTAISARIHERGEARRIYRDLVNRIIDPALVELAGHKLVRSSVFPVEPRGRQKLVITYEHLLRREHDRIDYYLGRSESLEYDVPWQITANIKNSNPVSAVYSSSHEIVTHRISAGNLTVNVSSGSRKNPGRFHLSFIVNSGGPAASLFAYPQSSVNGGYFMLLAGLGTQKKPKETPAIKRELTLVIDRSGSMRGEKLEQVKESALQIIAGLEDGELFNIAIYSNSVEWFSVSPVEKNNDTFKSAQSYLAGTTASGGTNIYEALEGALAQAPNAGRLPVVLFLTDGLPTVNRTGEKEIAALAEKQNPHNRRVFTIGVGVDLNAPLLDRIAEVSGGRSEFILPAEDIEVKIGRVFERLTGPVFTDVRLEILEADGTPAIGRTLDILPGRIADVYEDEQIVLLGKYVGSRPLTFRLSGNYRGTHRSFDFAFSFDKADPGYSFVPRLWAGRKIAVLTESIRQAGADANTNDPRIKELVDEVIRISTEFGILTEYTAFLANEGMSLAEPEAIRREAADMFRSRAISSRSGMDAVSQSYNYARRKSQTTLNYSNEFYDSKMKHVRFNSIRQLGDRTFYQKSNRWVDSRLVNNTDSIRPERIIQFGSDAYFELAEKLARRSRQSLLTLKGEIVVLIDNEVVLVEN